jgi:cysteine sulfinate desulfinase/cysteine desulfurase-like protein
LGCTARRIHFTGGGSEANNLVIKGTAFDHWKEKGHLITSAIEHPSVLATFRWLEEMGFHVTFLPVDEYGRVDPQDLERAITDRTFLVSVMAANNETGTLQQIRQMAQIAHGRKIPFHTDAVQAVGKIPVDVETLEVDFLTLSGHKLHGPKGIGAMYMRKGVRLHPLVHGGHQENGMRAGTENTLGIVGLGKAAELAEERLKEMNHRVRDLRDRLHEGLTQIIPGLKLNGHVEERLPNTLNITLPGIRGESMVIHLDRMGVSLSSGSACRSGSPDPSHALLAMGLTEEMAHCALRFSLGIENKKEEIDSVVKLTAELISNEIGMVRFTPCR